MRKYSEYKNSGIPWIGNIPSHWNIERGKNVLTLLDRPIMDTDDVITCFRDGEVTLRKNRREEGFTLSFQEIGYQGIEPGDLVVHGMDGFAGAIGVSDSRGKATPVLNVMDSIHNKRFLMYYLRTAAYKDVFMSLSTGIRVRSCDLRWNKLSVFPFVLPEREEQDRIAEYIDDKLLQINNIISEAKASIEEYKAWKASIIYEAVTKGLDPNVEMRNSGVEWIGKIPSHWKCTKVRQIAEFINGFAFQSDDLGSEGKYPVVKIGDIQDGKVNFMSCQCTSLNEELSGVQIKKEDILLAMSGATVGKVGYVFDMPLKNSYINQRVGIYRMKETPKFYFYIFSQPFYVEYALLNASGTAQPNISTESAKNFFVPIPPLNERETICKYLDKICPNIDEVIADKKALIEDLESYKKSLIFEVVTGKRKVL